MNIAVFNLSLLAGWLLASAGAGLIAGVWLGLLGGVGVGLLACGALLVLLTVLSVRMVGGIYVSDKQRASGMPSPDGPTSQAATVMPTGNSVTISTADAGDAV